MPFFSFFFRFIFPLFAGCTLNTRGWSASKLAFPPGGTLFRPRFFSSSGPDRWFSAGREVLCRFMIPPLATFFNVSLSFLPSFRLVCEILACSPSLFFPWCWPKTLQGRFFAVPRLLVDGLSPPPCCRTSLFPQVFLLIVFFDFFFVLTTVVCHGRLRVPVYICSLGAWGSPSVGPVAATRRGPLFFFAGFLVACLSQYVPFKSLPQGPPHGVVARPPRENPPPCFFRFPNAASWCTPLVPPFFFLSCFCVICVRFSGLSPMRPFFVSPFLFAGTFLRTHIRVTIVLCTVPLVGLHTCFFSTSDNFSLSHLLPDFTLWRKRLVPPSFKEDFPAHLVSGGWVGPLRDQGIFFMGSFFFSHTCSPKPAPIFSTDAGGVSFVEQVPPCFASPETPLTLGSSLGIPHHLPILRLFMMSLSFCLRRALSGIPFGLVLGSIPFERTTLTCPGRRCTLCPPLHFWFPPPFSPFRFSVPFDRQDSLLNLCCFFFSMPVCFCRLCTFPL